MWHRPGLPTKIPPEGQVLVILECERLKPQGTAISPRRPGKGKALSQTDLSSHLGQVPPGVFCPLASSSRPLCCEEVVGKTEDLRAASVATVAHCGQKRGWGC